MKKEGASSKARRTITREVCKLRRAVAPLGPESWAEGGMHGWLRERTPLERRRQADGFGGKAQERVVGGKPFTGHEVGERL